ncbi:TIM-barrel domain-containing protein [Zhouia amylolytica]|uniref:Alpha-xylosidase n=1 Tax=Zhouia amylolytica AD3 TaxID=1286632 RepID=W2UP12_9FLAO|nr:TIM-barrel domain-containing protein [Zhouia amylolytica]ETN95082.1 alpha-xylosidase [Zhouia amylolytica AD3]
MKIIKPINRFYFVLFAFLWGLSPGQILAHNNGENITASIQDKKDVKISSVEKINQTTVKITFSDTNLMFADFYADHIFRLFQDNSGKGMRPPKAEPEANILVDNPRKKITELKISETEDTYDLTTQRVKVSLHKNNGTFSVTDLKLNVTVLETLKPIEFLDDKVEIALKEHSDEFFYGGGVQNGRFSHKGKAIAIENQNSWTDGGVASPTPYYWSSKGYGFMWYSFKKGKYDFGAKQEGEVKLYHETDYLDVFFMINDGVSPLLNDFYQLTGNPVLLPKFGFYQGHLNAYNRDFWKEDEKGILFEDGKRYKESQKDNGGIKESLNGEKDNYQFSARAAVDRYLDNDMPLGWILPNDGYGAGYGQTETLDGNIKNLKEFGDYARSRGVEIGLWTQSDLHPKEGVSALLQRDIVKEVRDAGVRVLKTDVAWVGAGYSFGLNGVADVGEIMPEYGNDARPFIISLDGWAGTQRYAGIWSGDQTGGVWEYIRFHIPTYIGSGLSGQPNITSDMDGIFGGKNPFVNARDFQWKTFTPMQLNMDGWGANEKYPQALGEPTTSINRNYLKLKSELLPYAYSIAKESVDGLPMIRAMFLEDENAYTQGVATQYQFMYGPAFLVAPIYKETKMDEKGNDIRNGIYLPEGLWVDYFTGEQFEGNQIINSFSSPIWKLPVFVKRGAIIPMVNPNNNPSEINTEERIYELYPYQTSSFKEYDDDGVTEAYKKGEGTYTLIESKVDKKNNVLVTIHPTTGNYTGFEKEKSTEFRINVTKKPKKVVVKVAGKKVKLKEVATKEDLKSATNAYFYEKQPDFNQFSTEGSDFENVQLIKNPRLIVKVEKVDISSAKIALHLKGFEFKPQNNQKVTQGPLQTPDNSQVAEDHIQAYTLKPSWNEVANADYYEILFNNMQYTTIKDKSLLFEGLQPETSYTFKLRAVNKDGVSEWTQFSAQTASNPLEFAIQDIEAVTSVKNQGGYGISKFFDFDEGNQWHTKWGEDAIPFDLVIDLKTFNQLDKFQYLPRRSGGNGIWLKGKVYYSNDKVIWTEAGSIDWERNNETKTFEFAKQPTARFIKIKIEEGVGGYGSGRELYVFKVPGTESYLPGDINNDGIIDNNDLTSYTNYTGLRKGDADFEGYVSIGDVNKNNLIDAYDISVVATQLEGGVEGDSNENVTGELTFTTNKKTYSQGEIIEVRVKGKGLKAVNALSMAIPYNEQDYEFVAIQPKSTVAMENLTNNRLHSDGERVLYPTFVNIGEKQILSGDKDLFLIRFKAKRKLKIDLDLEKVILVDKELNAVTF